MASNSIDVTENPCKSDNPRNNHVINSEEELIDLEKELPQSKDSNWLFDCNSKYSDFAGSFNELTFSNPLIKDVIKEIYQNGKSKQMLHSLLYWNDKMTISCDNYSYLFPRSPVTKRKLSNIRHRHSLVIASRFEKMSLRDSESPTDSLNSSNDGDLSRIVDEMEIINNNSTISDRMTQSSIADYNPKFSIPRESTALPSTKTVTLSSSSQNILSRTYDKEDLEILKQTELSQSVFVPHISGCRIEQYSEIDMTKKLPGSSSSGMKIKSSNSLRTNSSFSKRTFPTGDSSDVKVRPTSIYQIDRLNNIPSSSTNKCVKVSNRGQSRQLNFNTKKLLKTNENVFDTDVLTPINSPRKFSSKHFTPNFFPNNNNNSNVNLHRRFSYRDSSLKLKSNLP